MFGKYQKIISDNIAKYRYIREMTRSELSHYSGISRSAVLRLEKYEVGNRVIGLAALVRIAVALKVEPADLLKDESNI